MKNYSICAWRVKIMAFVPVVGMACCGAYASNLTKRSLPVKALVYCSETRPTGFDPSQYEASPDYTVATTLFNRLLEYKRDNITKSNSVSPSAGRSQKIDGYTHFTCGAAGNSIPRLGLSPRATSTQKMCSLPSSGCATRICRSTRPTRLNFQTFNTVASARLLLRSKHSMITQYGLRGTRAMPRFCLIWRCPLHRFFLLNTLHNCWKGGSRQRSIRNQSAQVRLFSANMIKIRSFISTAIQRIGNPMMCGCLS